jgi:hypothetical protein
MGIVEDGQAIDDGKLRSRVRLNVPDTHDKEGRRKTKQKTNSNEEEEEEIKDHGRVKRTFGRTPDGTGTDNCINRGWEI